MKKIVSLSTALLAVLALAACSNGSQSTASSSEKASSSVEVKNESTSTSKEAKSSDSSAAVATIGSIELLSDQEIDSAKTIGDLKNLYKKWSDKVTEYTTEIGKTIPADQRADYNEHVEEMKETLNESIETFNEGVSQMGSDDTVLPESVLSGFKEGLKASNKAMKESFATIQTNTED